ncbi:MAG: alpha/beta fold hydrolase, partial [Pseudomonadota bacterium]
MLARLLHPSRTIDAETPPIGEFVEVEGVRLHFVEAGRRDAPALILIHGASGNLRDWTSSIFDDLARDWRVIAFDRPGYGHSEFLPQGSWLIAAQVDAMRAAMRKLGHRKYAIFGHSYGVAVALDWALRYPDEVAGMLNMSGAMLSWRGFLGWRYRWGGNPAIGR